MDNSDATRQEEQPKSDAEKTDTVSDEHHDTEEVLTFKDIIEEEQKREDIAKALFGSSDEKSCTYPEGYKPRQAVFACLTCVPEPGRAGVCYGCSLNCHEGHNVVELYTKRKFKCDCGTAKFDKKCSLYEEKDSENKENVYNQNYRGTFCVCQQVYPCETTNEDMITCVVCEDWFHLSHLVGNPGEAAYEGLVDSSSEMICNSCAKRMPFFGLLEKTTGVVCLSSSQVPAYDERPFSLPSLWRTFLCSCSGCEDLYDRNDCSFVLDQEDCMLYFEEQSMKMASQAKEPDADDLINELVKTTGRENAITVIKGYHDFKTQLESFLTNAVNEKNFGYCGSCEFVF